MTKKEEKNLGYLGWSFQVKLVKQLIEDNKFSEGIIDIIDPKYFDNEYLRLIVAAIKNYYEGYETIPNYVTLIELIKIINYLILIPMRNHNCNQYNPLFA